jgi:hypothetical protein
MRSTVGLRFSSFSALALLASGVVWSYASSAQIVVTCGDDDPNCTRRAAAHAAAEQKRAEEARLKPLIDAEVARLGAHRRAEAEKFVRMREAAEKARGKSDNCTRRAPRKIRNPHTGSMEVVQVCLDTSRVSPQ